MVKLSEDKEVELLLKSIEEGSKQAQKVLFALVVTSIYILLSALFPKATDAITLPLLGVELPKSAFFAVSPLIILALHLYLHIYVADLRSKLTAFEGVNLSLSIVPSRRMLFFPWIVNLGSYEHSMPEFYVRTLKILLIWLLGPVTLFVLWFLFVGQEDPVSLLPCAALIVSIYLSSGRTSRARSTRVAALAMSLVLVAVSFSSVPELRGHSFTQAIWRLAVAIPADGLLLVRNLSLFVGFLLMLQFTLTVYLYNMLGKSLRDEIDQYFQALKSRIEETRSRGVAYYAVDLLFLFKTPSAMLAFLFSGLIVLLLVVLKLGI